MTSVEAARARSPSAAYAALVVGAIAMGASPIFVRLAEVGPFASAFWRVALAMPVLWAWDRAQPRPGLPFVSPSLVLAGLAFAGDLTFWHLAILRTTVANATFFATTAPVFVLVISWLFLREKVRLAMLGGLCLCMAGGAALLGETASVAPQRLAGDLFGIVTALFFGLYFIFVSAARRDYGSARVILVSTIASVAVLLVVVLVSGESLMPRSVGGMTALVAMALISHVGGQGLLAYALGTMPATFSSLVMFLEAIAASAMAWALFDEALSAVQMLGGVVIVLGIWIARPRPEAAAR